MMMKMSRRQLLRRSLLSAFALTSAGTLLTGCGGKQHTSMETLPPRTASKDFIPDIELRLRAVESKLNILPGPQTTVWTYQAELLKGDPTSLQTLPDSYLGPVIRARSGQKIRVYFENSLPGQDELSIIHWHGLRLHSEQDAHPRYAIRPGQTYVYEFTVKDRAGTYWYHPHPHGRSGQQVYNGMAGLLLISDDEEAAAGLPSGAQDIPLVIQDRTFDAHNQLVYPTGTGEKLQMVQLMGFLGEQVLVNGRPDYTLELSTRAYRLRLLNASNTRIYKVAWEDGTPLTLISSDGGLLERPLQRDYVMLAPGERVELWADFGERAVGTELRLQSIEFFGAEGETAEGGGHGDHGAQPQGGHGDHGAQPQDSGHGQGTDGHGAHSTGAAPAIGAPLTILTARISSNETESLVLPAQLSTIPRYRLEDAVNREKPHTVTLTQENSLWRINGEVYAMDKVAPEDVFKRDTLYVWEVVNALNPDEPIHKMGMAHPIHIHGGQFQVVERSVMPELSAGWHSVHQGVVEEGWKDTVLVMPGQSVKLLVRFSDVKGMLMYHCHMLEHEDLGMMRNFEVVDRE